MALVTRDPDSAHPESTGRKPAPITHLEVGAVIAERYQLAERLGVGGFGSVFRATQIDIGREVALKILHGDLLLSSVGVQRFTREARLAQRLEHPHTVRLYDFGHTPDGLPFIAFQLLRGQPLDRVVAADGPMSPRRAVNIAKQVLKSLMEAHELGIVHRDVKPENIFITDFQGEPDFVKVLDFGVAKPLITDPDDCVALTAHGELVGTPNYMAPEQVLGQRIVPATDLYALGLVLAEMLSGLVVIPGTVATEVCQAQISPHPVAVPDLVLWSPLGRVIRRATAKHLDDRYHTAVQMLDDLEQVVASTSDDELDTPVAGPSAARPSATTLRELKLTPDVSAPPPAHAQTDDDDDREQEPTDRRRLALWIALGAVAVLVLAAITGISIATLLEPRRAPADSAPTAPPSSPTEPSLDLPYQGQLASLTPQALVHRLESGGWRVDRTHPVQRTDGSSMVSHSVARGTTAGELTLYHVDDAAAVPLVATSMRSPRRQVLFEGHKILIVELVDPTTGQADQESAQALVNSLVR